MKKIEKPKDFRLPYRENNNQNGITMEAILQLMIDHDYETARIQFILLSEEDEDTILYYLVKTRLEFEEENWDDYFESNEYLFYGDNEYKGLSDHLMELVRNENWERLDNIVAIGAPMIHRSDTWSKAECLICILILDFHMEEGGLRELLLLDLMSLTFDDHISLFGFYQKALELIEPYIEAEPLGVDLLNGIRRIQLVNNHD